MTTPSPSLIAKLERLQPLARDAIRRLHPTVIQSDESREPAMWYCRKCETYWPRTEEFFYRGSDGLFNSPCRACIQEQKQEMHAVRTCAVEGCPNPRHQSASGRYTSYCTDHLHHKRRKGRKS